MNLSNYKIGIWGYGVVGKSLINFLFDKDIKLSILEKRKFSDVEKKHLLDCNVKVYDQNSELDKFLQENDFVIPSPGIDLDLYKNFSHKLISELDLFSFFFRKNIIAITGTVGKTTVTHLISELAKLSGKKVVAAGNIGLGMCDLLKNQDEIDIAVLEVSSYQLEYNKFFAPNLSIWTNFFPNHLDRHKNLESYFDAKLKICTFQKANDNSLLPINIAQKFNDSILCNKSFFSLEKPSVDVVKKIKNFGSIFFIDNDLIMRMSNDYKIEQIYQLNKFPQITFPENWLIICAAMNLQNIKLNNIEYNNLIVPNHRLEKFLTISDVDFYDDSKSTLSQSTLAAVSKLKNKPIILFLGGLSKGVDRSVLINELKDKIKFIICFGKEADILDNLCKLNNISSNSFSNLEDAISYCFKIMKPNDQVLFSPSGSSFDLFYDYKDRGNKFKQLISQMSMNIS